MPIIKFPRLPQSTATLAAVVGATRALEMAFPAIPGEAMLDRLSKAVAALIQMEAMAELQTAAGAA